MSSNFAVYVLEKSIVNECKWTRSRDWMECCFVYVSGPCCICMTFRHSIRYRLRRLTWFGATGFSFCPTGFSFSTDLFNFFKDRFFGGRPVLDRLRAQPIR